MKKIFAMTLTMLIISTQLNATNWCKKYHDRGAEAYEQAQRTAKNGQLDSTLRYLDSASSYYIKAKYKCKNGKANYGKGIKQIAEKRSMIVSKIKERQLKRKAQYEKVDLAHQNRIAEYKADMNKTVEVHKKTFDELVTELQAGRIDKETFKKGLEPIINEIMLKSSSTFMPLPIPSN